MNTTQKRKVYVQDVTLRDGNQALKKPWTIREKEVVFDLLVDLNVDGIEIGFPSSNQTEFDATKLLAARAPKSISIAALTRANRNEIQTTWEALQHAANPRMHIVFPVSAFAIENVLKISYEQVLEKIYDSVSYARTLVGKDIQIQFSGEHFGDAMENLDFATKAFLTSIEAGANIINLPNTVERYRPMLFVDMVKHVVSRTPEGIRVSVHAHNDLGMATATTVESFYAGASQIEVALNGLGERAGNTNLYETAIALHQCGEDVGIRFHRIYPTAKRISELTNIPIGEKTPVIGEDIFSHRSGIHQDGVAKTVGKKKGAYRTFTPEFVGRNDEETISFTNQSGARAIRFLFEKEGISMREEEIQELFHKAKEVSSREGNREIGIEELSLWRKEIQPTADSGVL
ncbi:2-isopropylmalate synthase LeuA2 [Leptospira idonii]|uniref:2-isopropylmalate synthase n=1 Tax=Leptospira idonii TaxID=1193500 RepID=A0A4R9M3Q5_9LEPT|nr:2-isopropylmalate synthase LeuA2 [Leptospira idonii]TGN20611.1 2-isopropylmalate synthase [Leptospira idonii]